MNSMKEHDDGDRDFSHPYALNDKQAITVTFIVILIIVLLTIISNTYSACLSFLQ